MNRNTSIRSSSRDSFADALADLTLAAEAIPDEHRKPPTDASGGRWNATQLRKSLQHLDPETGRSAATGSFRAAGSRRHDRQPGESGTLTYEQALRLHSRTNNDQDDLGPPDRPENSGATLAGRSSAASAARRNRTAEEASLPSRPTREEELIPPESRRNSLADPGAPAAVSRSRAAANSPARKAPPDGGSLTDFSLPAHQESTSERITDKRKSHGQNTSGARSKPGRSAASRKASGQTLANIIFESAGRELLTPEQAPAQKRTVVSLRLTRDELEQLRLRADESGISVSAYMRSCVLEAESLRTQVRHVMAEMRALSAASLIQQHALVPTHGAPVRQERDWMRTALQSASSLFRRPLVAFRRGA